MKVQFDFETTLPPQRYKPRLATVLPRSIASETTCDARLPRIEQAPVSHQIALGSLGLVLGLMVHASDEAVIDVGLQYIDTEQGRPDRSQGDVWNTKTRDRFEVPPIALSGWNGSVERQPASASS